MRENASLSSKPALACVFVVRMNSRMDLRLDSRCGEEEEEEEEVWWSMMRPSGVEIESDGMDRWMDGQMDG